MRGTAGFHRLRFFFESSPSPQINKADTKVLAELKGKDLEGVAYEPLFDYLQKSGKIFLDKAYHVVCDEYVGTDAGTMIVHQAPQHGEDDNRVCSANGIIAANGQEGMPILVDEAGCFTEEVYDFVKQ